VGFYFVKQRMKIALAQLNYHVGNFESNTQKIINRISEAKKHGVNLIVFSELCLTGYPPKDFLEFSDFIRLTDEYIKTIAEKCDGITAIVGAPSRNEGEMGKRLFNTAYVLANGGVQQAIHKTLLPTYDVFDEYRYFEPNTIFETIHVDGIDIALTICEDLWNIGEDILYTTSPMDLLMEEKPALMINIAASPFGQFHIENRKKVLLQNVEKYQLPLLYVNHVGAQTELIFDGGSMAINPNGEVIDELAYFDEEFKLYGFDEGKLTQIGEDHTFLPDERIELIHDALITGIRDYFQKSGFKKAVLGSSGGIDSAVVQALAVRALGAENVRAVLMPSEYSSDHSINDAKLLSENLGTPYDILPIEKPYNAFTETLKETFEGKTFDVTEENIQSRSRGIILMAISNKFGNILLNTSNKSELAVGYGTLYGDMAGGLGVIGDVYKVQVYDLARFINKDREVIPQNIIDKAPSAELRPDQKDSDSLPDYDILDKILYHYIEESQGPDEIISKGYDKALVLRILRMVNTNEYKRHQTPPILRVTNKAFGSGRRMPIVGKYLS
jgi:NAD+ synthase (glutamine-hydrolysing)